MNPIVSVIVCTYNQEGTIGAALDSILAQITDFDYEIVVADDCSTDGTRDICRDYAARFPDRIRLILNDENLGIADNYFGTLYECRGKYIADLAGDDIWSDPHKLSRQVAVMDSDPAIVLCHAAWRYLHADGSTSEPQGFARPEKPYVCDGATLVTSLLQHRRDKVFIHLCSAMYRRDTAVALTQKFSEFFYGRALPCEDFQLEVLMATAGRIAYDPTEVLLYRVGQKSISSFENPAKSAIFASKVAVLTHALATELNADMAGMADFFSRQMLFATALAFESGDKQAAAEAFAAVTATSPVLPLRARTALALMKVKPLWYLTRHAFKLLRFKR